MKDSKNDWKIQPIPIFLKIPKGPGLKADKFVTLEYFFEYEDDRGMFRTASVYLSLSPLYNMLNSQWTKCRGPSLILILIMKSLTTRAPLKMEQSQNKKHPNNVQIMTFESFSWSFGLVVHFLDSQPHLQLHSQSLTNFVPRVQVCNWTFSAGMSYVFRVVLVHIIRRRTDFCCDTLFILKFLSRVPW